MDCEKFESAMIDELYDELDELTSAAAKRHVAGCARCAAMLSGLRATRRVLVTAGGVPLEEPPASLEDRILAAAREAQKVVPFRRRAANLVSMAGSWAMRPQTAMAALFLLMIGSSAMFLKSSHHAPTASKAMTVTAKGEPAGRVAALPEQEPLDTAAASNAHGVPGKPAAAEAQATSALALAAPAATTTASPAEKDGLMDSLTGGQGRADKGSALAQLADDSEEQKVQKQKADQSLDRDRNGIGNAGAIGGAGGGGLGDPSAPATDAPMANAARPRSGGYGGDYRRPAAQAPAAAPAPQPASPPPPPQATMPARNAPADSKDAMKKEAARGPGGVSMESARALYAQGSYAEAARQFDALAATDPSAGLWAARSIRNSVGCPNAVARYESVAAAQAGTSIGYDAALEAGTCYRSMSMGDKARGRLLPLLNVPAYAERAKAQLDAIPNTTTRPTPRKSADPAPMQQAPSNNAY